MLTLKYKLVRFMIMWYMILLDIIKWVEHMTYTAADHQVETLQCSG